jgi:hypothetical protein
MMREWSNFIVALGLIVLSGCDRSDAERVQSAPQAAAVSQTQRPPTLEVEEYLTNDAPVTWLDDEVGADAREINWDMLIPADWQPEILMGDADIEDLSDDDPRAQQLLDQLRKLWDEAPVVEELSGQRVKLPGFVVPLEIDARSIDQFLLVPYFGACIHVPPPPANQIVYVVMRDDTLFEGALFDVVWVTGTMQVERLSNDLGIAGYRIDDATVVPYEVPDE